MKQFKLTFGDKTRSFVDYSLGAAEQAIESEFHPTLRTLEVGETLVDEDGDTWERIA